MRSETTGVWDKSVDCDRFREPDEKNEFPCCDDADDDEEDNILLKSEGPSLLDDDAVFKHDTND
jgi:hypothetical protein